MLRTSLRERTLLMPSCTPVRLGRCAAQHMTQTNELLGARDRGMERLRSCDNAPAPSRRSTTRRASHACTSRGQARRRGGVSGAASLELCLAEQERQKELDAQAKTPSTRVEVPSVG